MRSRILSHLVTGMAAVFILTLAGCNGGDNAGDSGNGGLPEQTDSGSTSTDISASESQNTGSDVVAVAEEKTQTADLSSLEPFGPNANTWSMNEDGDEVLIYRLVDDNPTTGDVGGVLARFETTVGARYVLRVDVYKSYTNTDYPGVIAQKISIDSNVVDSYDIASEHAGWREVVHEFEATKSETEVAIYLEAVGEIRPWNWGGVSKSKVRIVTLEPVGQ